MVSRIAWLYIAVVVGAAIALVAVAQPQVSDIQYWIDLNILRLLFLVCDSTPTPAATRQSAWSPSSAAILAAVVLLGPFGAAMVGAVSVLSPQRHLRLARRLFNGAMYALTGYLAGETFVALQRSYPPGHAPFGRPLGAYFPALLLPFAAAAVVHVLANHGLMWGVLRANRGRGRVFGELAMESSLPLLLVSDLGFAALGLVIAALCAVMPSAVAAAIVLVPLFVARWAMGQFAEQQTAYAATMAALCQAVETKDFYTRGHSERVSRGSGMIARQIGMRADRAEALTFAGMLHDVGKLGVPTKVLQKTGPLTEEEYAAIQLHPMRGLEIVREIGFLNEALAGIMHHHERIDGRGYPMGFAGDEIPEFARVIGVADAFDSITSNRSYRKAGTIPEGIEELRKGAGSQFDPVMVQAFIAALEREGWRLQEAADLPPDAQLITAQDHDDPTAPLRVIESA
jgi:HD-GYP domain-containing protein (c-di-GMP phosphodiesterase class II)